MNEDTYGEIINGEDTYREIATDLRESGRCLVGWTDQDSTHLDILFVYRSPKYGTVQGGVQGSDLFVSIMRRGAFGFSVSEPDTAPAYYDEKLGGGLNATSIQLAALVNGVKKALQAA